MCSTVSMACTIRPGPCPSYPVKSGNWPKTIFIAVPVMNPVITEAGTNRTSDPSLKIPRRSMTSPISMDSVNSARSGSAAFCTSPTSAITTAIALVACTTI